MAALADGTLPVSRRPGVERAVAASAELQEDLAAQRRALAALSVAAEERAPSALRARLELARDPRSRRYVPSRRWAAIAPAAAALAAVLALTLGSSTSGGPTVATAATLAVRPAEAPAVVSHADSTALAWPSASGLEFPNWARQFGLQAVGARVDRLDGRVMTTVYYARGSSQVAYTIVSGRPLAAGASVHTTMWEGTRLSSFRAQGRVVVTWLRSGHTCVLSGSPALLSELERLAGSPPREYRS
jgi:hypothetical protein